MVKGHSQGTPIARLDSHPSPPVKDQSKLWKQPQPQSRSPAPGSRQPRQRLKLSLPANTHRPAVELTINFLRRSPTAVKKKSHKIMRGRFRHELTRIGTNKRAARRRGGSAVPGQQSINYASTNATPTPVRPFPHACYKMRARDARSFPARNGGWPVAHNDDRRGRRCHFYRDAARHFRLARRG